MTLGMWTIPTIIVGLIIVIVSYFMTINVMKKTEQRASAMDTPISRNVRNHPILMNPIIIMYLIFGLFTGIMIFYYWAKTGY